MIPEGLHAFSKVLITFSNVSFKKLSSVSSLEIASSKESFWAFWYLKWMEDAFEEKSQMSNFREKSAGFWSSLTILEK